MASHIATQSRRDQQQLEDDVPPFEEAAPNSPPPPPPPPPHLFSAEAPSNKMNFVPFFSQKHPPSFNDPDPAPASTFKPVQSPIRRKPVPNSSAALNNNSSPSSRPSSLLKAGRSGLESPGSEFEFTPRDLDQNPHGRTPVIPQNEYTFGSINGSVKGLNIQSKVFAPRDPPRPQPSPSHARFASESLTLVNSTRSLIDRSTIDRRFSDMSFSSTTLALPAQSGNANQQYEEVPKSPASNRFTAFFGWGGNSDRPMSPTLSPKSTTGKNIPAALDIPRANASRQSSMYSPSDSAVMLPPVSPSSVEAIEEEVRLVSADLAASIRREMDLEDLVERLQMEASAAGSRDRRTSDYYSDAGTPVRSLDGDSNSKESMDIEKWQRKAEQEKAQLRLEMLAKVSDERQRRKAVELHVRELEQRVARGEQQKVTSPLTSDRVRELEMQLEEAKRKLVEERKVKENFEDLLVALRQDIEDHRNERDNLRDEVVPQLQARVEGLEAEAAELQKLTYEHTKMQQEVMNLKNENAMLISTQRQIVEMRTQMDRQQKRASIAVVQQVSGIPSVVVSGTSTPPPTAKGESLQDKLKDVEEQRDALHRALKSLRERQEYEAKKARERIKALELERDRALQGISGRHSKEVRSLRNEVDRLKNRAEEALEAKYHCERGLGTLKMDLERAEQETATLRALLRGHDALLAQHEELQKSHAELAKEVLELRQAVDDQNQSPSLERAYRDLQLVHEMTLARLDQLESKGNDLSTDLEERQQRLMDAHNESDKIIQRLKQEVADAEAARDTALIEAEAYRKRADALAQSEDQLLNSERTLASQLRSASLRVEELAAQIRMQLDTNNELRTRLADAISRGESEQRSFAARINEFQGKFKKMEERIIQAQQENEDAVARHEEEIRAMKDNHNNQLRRLKSSMGPSSSTSGSPKLPISPMLRSPKLSWAQIQSRRASLSNQSKVHYLSERVQELERALAEADREMEEVVGRMSLAQMEVLELQSQRDEAARQTRRLQAEIAAERAKNVGLLAANN